MTTFATPLFTEVKEDDGRPAVTHTGAMIALRPRQDHIDRLALEDGEAPENLHTTILFLGKAADYGYDTRDRIIQAMREVAQRSRQVTGNGFYVTQFNPNGDEPCIVLGVGGQEMVDIRNDIVRSLQGFDLLQVPEQHEPWTPHVTLAYTDDASDVPDMGGELTGEIVYDAIRVAFGSIVDDIPLQQGVSGNDGYAGGNRYSAVPLTVNKSFHTMRVPVFPGVALDEKVIRRVRTAAGVHKYGQPIGSVILGGGSTPLKNLKEQPSEYEGYNKYKSRGKTYYTHKNGDRFEALDQNDQLIASNASEEVLLRDLDSGKLSTSTGHVTVPGKATADKEGDTPGGLKKVESDYDDYDKFMGQNGKPIYRWHGDGKFYDENDEPADVNDYNGEKVKADLTKKKPITADVTAARTSVSNKPGMLNNADKQALTRMLTTIGNDYANDDSRAAQQIRGIRDRLGEYQDRNALLADLDKVKFAQRPKEDAFKPVKDRLANLRGGKSKDAQSAEETPAKPRQDASAKPSGADAQSAKPQDQNAPQGQTQGTGSDVRSGLMNPDAVADLDAVLDKVVNTPGKTVPEEAVEEIRRIAMRQRDVRNRRKLMLYAQQLSEEKIFHDLCQMDFKLRMHVMEYKLITPGGRIGSDRKLGSRSNGENWVERSKVGGGSLPKYIRIVRNGLIKAGHSASRATALAVAAMKRWARGGNHVTPKVQAAAAAALAKWEAMKAAA